MFVALDITLTTRVTSLDPKWKDRFEELRAMAASDRLVCPYCKQTLLFKVGELRRPHFAHRVLSECPQSKQSAEVLEAKAKLYEWLCTKYPDQVEMDEDLHIAGWDRFADLAVHVTAEKTFAYWIFDCSPKNREALLKHHSENIAKNILFTTGALHKEENSTLRLSKAQRDFMKPSDFDPLSGFGHIHFLDAESGQLTIYRALKRICTSSLHEYNFRRETPLTSALICPNSGEIIVQEDIDEYQRQQNFKKQNPLFTPSTTPKTAMRTQRNPVISGSQSKAVIAPEPLWDGFYICQMCGIKTKETKLIQSANKTCICPKCLPEYNAKRLRELSNR